MSGGSAVFGAGRCGLGYRDIRCRATTARFRALWVGSGGARPIGGELSRTPGAISKRIRPTSCANPRCRCGGWAAAGRGVRETSRTTTENTANAHPTMTSATTRGRADRPRRIRRHHRAPKPRPATPVPGPLPPADPSPSPPRGPRTRHRAARGPGVTASCRCHIRTTAMPNRRMRPCQGCTATCGTMARVSPRPRGRCSQPVYGL
jgi:hypothetical protein